MRMQNESNEMKSNNVWEVCIKFCLLWVYFKKRKKTVTCDTTPNPKKTYIIVLRKFKSRCMYALIYLVKRKNIQFITHLNYIINIFFNNSNQETHSMSGMCTSSIVIKKQSKEGLRMNFTWFRWCYRGNLLDLVSP